MNTLFRRTACLLFAMALLLPSLRAIADNLSEKRTDRGSAGSFSMHRDPFEMEEGGEAEIPPVKKGMIRYYANGGTSEAFGTWTDQRVIGTHRYENTLQGGSYFHRDGYVLTGWNTAADGNGTHIGLGSRVLFSDGLSLYAEWEQSSPETDFCFEVLDDGIRITAYLGGETCVIPEMINNLPIRTIAEGAFSDRTLQYLVLPRALREVEEYAFQNCEIAELFFYDNLGAVSDDSFSDSGIHSIHINAGILPVYSGSYYSAFADKMDILRTKAEEKKLVLFSGSSGRYGYDSGKISEALPGYAVVNMGVYAYTNAKPQMDLILPWMLEGDILLSAPEFDAASEQFCVSSRLDPAFWAMMEADYDLAAGLDFGSYTGIFDSFSAYQHTRSMMPGRSYGESPASYDDDGNRYDFETYNEYGDFVLPRPNSPKDERLRHNIADYTVDSIPVSFVEALNAAYRPFLDLGIHVYFAYAPRNRSSLSATSTVEARQKLETEIKESLCVPVITDLESSLYSGIYFWMIDNHLSTEGVAIHTDIIIRALKKQMVKEQILPAWAAPEEAPAISENKTKSFSNQILRQILTGACYLGAFALAVITRVRKNASWEPYLAGFFWAGGTILGLIAGISQQLLLAAALLVLLIVSAQKRGDPA